MARSGEITFKGNPMTLAGARLAVGQPAPDFTLHFFDDGMQEITLADLKGKPSRFNADLAALQGKVNAVTVSCDLPFAQARFCGGADIANIRVASDYQERAFGTGWGTLIEELKLLARAVYVLDADGTIVHEQIVPEVTDEPDYDAALAALNKLLA